MAKRGRKPVLDEFKRREILAILSVGGSRRVAAAYVGCAPSTIHDTAERDEEFGDELRRAEYQSEIGYLQNIRNAARNERYWRAAAWALERLNPQKYGARGPNAVTIDQVRELLSQFTELILEDLSDERDRQKVVQRFKRISDSLKGASRKRGTA